MSPAATQILRLILAGLNGLLFALGTWYVMEQVLLRVSRWKRLLIKLENVLYRNPEHPSAAQIQVQIDSLRTKIDAHQRDPKTLLKIGMGFLVVTLAVAALIGLFAPPWAIILG